MLGNKTRIHGLCGKIRDKRWSMWHAAKSRAKLHNIPFCLSLNDIPSIPSQCPVLGIEINSISPKQCHNSPSLDRINNKLGYIPGNIRIISWRANNLKRDATPYELRKILEYVENH